MIFNNVILTAKSSDDIETIAVLLSEQAARSVTEPGCVRFEVFHSHINPAVFILIETWETQAHLDAHRSADAFVNLYVPKLLPLVERSPHPSVRLYPDEE